jgi:hypothetical protein
LTVVSERDLGREARPGDAVDDDKAQTASSLAKSTLPITSTTSAAAEFRLAGLRAIVAPCTSARAALFCGPSTSR